MVRGLAQRGKLGSSPFEEFSINTFPLSIPMNIYKKISIIIASVSLFPILVVPEEMWDGISVSLASATNNFDYMRHSSISLGWNMFFYLHYGLITLCNHVGINYKLISNIIAILLLLCIAFEVFKFLKNQCALSKKAAYFGAWIILSFPLWHTFLISGLQVRLISLWLFMVAVNLWPKNKLIATLVLIPSLQFFSLFSLAVGFLWTIFFLQTTRSTYLRLGIETTIYSACLLAGFIILNQIITIHGDSGTYNTFKLTQLDQIAYFVCTIFLTLAVWFGFSKLLLDKQESQWLLRRLVVFLLLYFFAALPYWAVGRPLRFFSFGSFGSRHAVLTCFSIAMVSATLAEVGLTYLKKKYVHGIMALLLSASIVLLYQGYDHKVAALLFRNMLTYSFQNVAPPESGYVSIREKGYKAPRHVHNSAVEMSLYRAYGSLAWITNGFWARRGYAWDKKNLIEYYTPKTRNKYSLAFGSEMSGNNYTAYDFLLENYHQEGRIWYWYFYLTKKYAFFNPRLIKIEP